MTYIMGTVGTLSGCSVPVFGSTVSVYDCIIYSKCSLAVTYTIGTVGTLSDCPVPVFWVNSESMVVSYTVNAVLL